MPPAVADAIAALSTIGGLGGLAAVITSLRALNQRSADVTAIKTAVTPNHGSSLADAVRRIEHGQDETRDALAALDRRVMHELGEVRRSADGIHEDHAARLRRLEGAL